MQEDETITSFPPESCVYADSQRQLMITKILLLIMMMMTIIPRKLHADPNWLKLYQFQCKRGVRQSTGNHGDTSWNQRNWIITKHVNTFLTGLNMDWSISSECSRWKKNKLSIPLQLSTFTGHSNQRPHSCERMHDRPNSQRVHGHLWIQVFRST